MTVAGPEADWPVSRSKVVKAYLCSARPGSQSYGFSGPALLLIRPDGHVAVRTTGDIGPIGSYVERWRATGWPAFVGKCGNG